MTEIVLDGVEDRQRVWEGQKEEVTLEVTDKEGVTEDVSLPEEDSNVV